MIYDFSGPPVAEVGVRGLGEFVQDVHKAHLPQLVLTLLRTWEHVIISREGESIQSNIRHLKIHFRCRFSKHLVHQKYEVFCRQQVSLCV